MIYVLRIFTKVWRVFNYITSSQKWCFEDQLADEHQTLYHYYAAHKYMINMDPLHKHKSESDAKNEIINENNDEIEKYRRLKSEPNVQLNDNQTKANDHHALLKPIVYILE